MRTDHNHDKHVHKWTPVPDIASHYDCDCGVRMFNAYPHLSDLWHHSLPAPQIIDRVAKRLGPSND